MKYWRRKKKFLERSSVTYPVQFQGSGQKVASQPTGSPFATSRGIVTYITKECEHPALHVDGGMLWGLPGGQHAKRLAEFDLSVFLSDTYLPYGLYANYGAVNEAKRIIYLPIEDMGIPKMHLFTQVIALIRAELVLGHSVAVSCVGGHGRTGMVLAGVWGSAHPADPNPIAAIRTLGCAKWVEGMRQINFVHEYLGKAVPADLEPSKMPFTGLGKGVDYGNQKGWGTAAPQQEAWDIWY